MKLVLDTNIFISSFFWGGNPRKIMERIIDGKDTLFIANEILTEVSSVMARPKFHVDEKRLIHFIDLIEEIANFVALRGEVKNICRDRDDDKILECAVLGNVNYIITGDDDLLTLGNCQGIKIITANEYINLHGLQARASETFFHLIL